MKKKKAFTIVETLFSSSVFGMVVVIGLSVISLISWTLYTGQAESTTRTTLSETIYFITREIQSAEGIKITENGKCIEIKENGSSGYNLKYSIVEAYPTDYLAFKNKILVYIDASESEFSFETNLLKLKLATVKNNIEPKQRNNEVEISILPRSNCVMEIER